MRNVIISMASGVFLMTGCGTPTHPCGTFTFSGSPDGNRGEIISDSFAFDPSVCSSPCNCDHICFIQIVRIIDRDTGQFLAPSSQQQARIVTGQSSATLNGWAVDRIDGRVWGYYGRNNDGTFASYLTTGNNTSPAVLGDEPSGWPDNSWFDAVDVPVCIDGLSVCLNNLLGYYYWLFIVDPGGTTGNPINEVGVDWNQQAVDLAIAQWNNTAAGVGKNVFPVFSKMH